MIMKIQGQPVYSVHTETNEKCKEIKHLKTIQHGASPSSPKAKAILAREMLSCLPTEFSSY